MNTQKFKHIACLTVAACLLSCAGFAAGEQASLEALLDNGTPIETIEPVQGDAPDAKAIIGRDGMKAVAVFAQVDGNWTLEAQSPWFPDEMEGAISLHRINPTVFTVELGTPADDSLQTYTFEKTNEGWQAVAFDSTDLHWQWQQDRSGFRFFVDSLSEDFPVCWHVMLTDIDFTKMPQTMEEMRALLLTDDIARITLAQYATVPLREAPAEDARYSYVLNDGAMLNVLDRQNGWTQLSLNDQLTGWVPDEVLEIGNQGYRHHYNHEMTSLDGSITILDEPSAAAHVLRETTEWPIVDIVGWCGGAFSDVSDGVWAIVLVQDQVGYVRLNALSYGNG